MKFTPCANQCTQDGSHCQGCGRSHEEIRETLKLVKGLSEFMVKMGYENPEEFASLVASKSVKRYHRVRAG